jgi:hypothetical protein
MRRSSSCGGNEREASWELIVDSTPTTYGHRNQLNQIRVGLITPRRRSVNMLQEIWVAAQ